MLATYNARYHRRHRTHARPPRFSPTWRRTSQRSDGHGRDGLPASPHSSPAAIAALRRTDHRARRVISSSSACETSPTSLRPSAPSHSRRHLAASRPDPTARKRRLVVIDEAWLLMRDPEGARFLYRAAKSARKHWCGLTVVTQDAGDLLSTDLGQAVVANAATQILLRQPPKPSTPSPKRSTSRRRTGLPAWRPPRRRAPRRRHRACRLPGRRQPAEHRSSPPIRPSSPKGPPRDRSLR